MLTSGSLILRFDDVTPGMAWEKFLPLKRELAALGVLSVLGVVPDCRDPSLTVARKRDDFFDLVRQWVAYGDTIAQHGTRHVYDSSAAGLLRIHRRSEFAGHSLDEQLRRVAEGREILVREGVWQPYFMAPSHSFDRNTLIALRTLGFMAVTDGFGFHPYEVERVVLVPQLTAQPLPVSIGVQTVCVHINGMSDDEIRKLLVFVRRNAARFVDFKNAARTSTPRGIWSSIMRGASAMGVRGVRALRAVAR